MKLSFAQQNQFLKTPNPNARVILIYGPDTGLVSERAEHLASFLVPNKDDPFAVSRMTGSEAKEQASKLFDEASALSFGGGRRLVRLQQALDANAKALIPFIEAPPACDSIILIEAGDLDARSKLRKLCESADETVVVLPCYIEDARARAKTVSAFLQNNKLSANRDVIQFLCDVLPPDRKAMTQELEKLTLFAAGQEAISLEDVKSVISDAGGADIDALIQACAGGNVKRTTQLLDYLISEQTSPVALVRGMQRHLMRLQIALYHMNEGMGAEGALKKLRPPVFWKNLQPMIGQCGRWSLQRIELRLAQLADAEAALKRTGTPDAALCAQLFLNIAVKG